MTYGGNLSLTQHARSRPKMLLGFYQDDSTAWIINDSWEKNFKMSDRSSMLLLQALQVQTVVVISVTITWTWDYQFFFRILSRILIPLLNVKFRKKGDSGTQQLLDLESLQARHIQAEATSLSFSYLHNAFFNASFVLLKSQRFQISL